MDQNDLWFNSPDSNTLCRGGGNGPFHPSQLYAILKYIKPIFKKQPLTFLDFGCGSATTYEALSVGFPEILPFYRGLDMIEKNIDYDKEVFPRGDFKVNKKGPNVIDEPNESWDVVYSRHVVDHMESFEIGLDEHCRVSKKWVIIILWYGLNDREEHDIKNIIDGPQDNRQTFKQEYLNQYSRSKVKEYIASKNNWELVEFTEGIHNAENRGSANQDICIVLKRK